MRPTCTGFEAALYAPLWHDPHGLPFASSDSWTSTGRLHANAAPSAAADATAIHGARALARKKIWKGHISVRAPQSDRRLLSCRVARLSK
jgi:hypothetical protein